MDIFKFTNPTASTRMEQGLVINGIKSKMWIERYRDAGEFKLVATIDSGIRTILPIGSFISHVDTTEIMIVENHEINDNKDQESEITITGRSFETILENRIVGSNRTFPRSGVMVDYPITVGYTQNQAVQLITDHILPQTSGGELLNTNNQIRYVTTISQVTSPGISIPRSFKRGTVYQRLLELLSIENLGIKIIRPGTWSPLGAASINSALAIHKGTDRSSQVVFAYSSGQIDNSDYLWSNKEFKNAAYIYGKWVETGYYPTAIEYDRRIMMIDATDLDQDQTVAPTGATLTNIVNNMNQRAIEILASQTNTALTKAEVSKNAVKYAYRTDYNVGDIVAVHGDYNQSAKMRVSEFVEIEDETGESGYPTLTM